MASLFRDTVLGQVVRLATRGKVFQYAEEKEAGLWQQYVEKETPAGVRSTSPPRSLLAPVDFEKESAPHTPKPDQDAASASSGVSSDTAVGDLPSNQANGAAAGKSIDPEKGRDTTMITWYSETDPEVRTHFGPGKCEAYHGRIR